MVQCSTGWKLWSSHPSWRWAQTGTADVTCPEIDRSCDGQCRILVQLSSPPVNRGSSNSPSEKVAGIIWTVSNVTSEVSSNSPASSQAEAPGWNRWWSWLFLPVSCLRTRHRSGSRPALSKKRRQHRMDTCIEFERNISPAEMGMASSRPRWMKTS